MTNPATAEMPEKMPLTSMDIAEEKREELRQAMAHAFPEVFAEGAIDFDQFKRVLGEWVEPDRERFGLNWPGKAACMKVIQAPSVGTLKPCPEESVDWDTTQNLFIEGDNLEVLKLLQKAYFGKVKMIYIDPPYNTGKEFIYPDKYAETLETYLEYTGQKDSEGRKFATNTDTSGRFHSRWLNMMYPRLYLAKNLLRDDGFIVVSIDDSELYNLKLMMNDLFGEENYLATLVWDRNRKNDAKYFSVGHEYMVVYARNEAHLKEKGTILRTTKEGVDEIRELFEQLRQEHGDDWNKIRDGIKRFFAEMDNDDPRMALARYTKVDERGPYRDDGNINWPGGGGPTYDVLHPVTGKPCKKPVSGWRYPTIERFNEEVEKGRIVFGEDENTVPRVRSNLFESDAQVLGSVHYSYAQTASNDFTEVFDGSRVFENPKSFKDLANLCTYLTGPDDLVLDFFAGSASSAHGVILSNLRNDTRRRFIMVQLPEPIDSESEAGKLGFHTIADVGRERLRRVGQKVALMKPDYSGDLGFRAYKLDSSCFKQWDGDVTGLSEDQLVLKLKDHAQHIDGNAKAEDILYEVLLKDGFELTVPIQKLTLAGKEVFSVEGNQLLICLEKELTQELMDALAALNPSRVIVLDAGFQNNDQLKANAVQTFKARARDKETAIVFRTV